MKNRFLEHRQTSPTFDNCFAQQGITVVELMTVVCLIGVISSIGIVSLKPIWQKHLLQLSVDKVEEQIHLLRLKAIIEKKTYEMKMSGCCLEYRRKNASKWENWQKHQLNQKVAYSMSGSIYFNSKGFVSPKTITINLENHSQRIIININGRIRKSEGS